MSSPNDDEANEREGEREREKEGTTFLTLKNYPLKFRWVIRLIYAIFI